MSKSYVTVAQVATDSSRESGKRRLDSESAMMAHEASAEDQMQSDLVADDQAAVIPTVLRKFMCYTHVSADARTLSSDPGRKIRRAEIR